MQSLFTAVRQDLKQHGLRIGDTINQRTKQAKTSRESELERQADRFLQEATRRQAA